MRICLVADDANQPPASFQSLLSKLGEVTYYSPQNTSALEEALRISALGESHGKYVFWQVDDIARNFAPWAPHKIFIVPNIRNDGQPMAAWSGYVGCRFLALTRADQESLQIESCASSYFQYYPEMPDELGHLSDLAMYFHYSDHTDRNTIESLAAVCKSLEIDAISIIVQDAAPIDMEGLHALSNDHIGFRIIADPRQADGSIYFASSRPIGIDHMSLQALARGCVVVSPDTPLMRDYIAPWTSGLLYDPANPASLKGPLDREKIQSMGRAATRKAQLGRSVWARDMDRLASLLSDDGRRWTGSDYSAGFGTAIRRAASRRASRAG